MRKPFPAFPSAIVLLLAISITSPCALFAQSSATERIVIDASAQATPLPHFWEHLFGSGRAILSLRDSYRQDLREVKKITAMRYIRFHAIFHDEVGVYDEDAQGNPVFNFSYVNQIYDGLLSNGVRPFVELSFMPKKLASNKDALHAFWYKPNVSPPRDYAKWDEMITQFARHLVERYGIDEVSQWYFEVWNEPNIDFWAGDPRQATYFELYDHTARALKAVSPRLRVGGPSTAQAAWADAFIKHCSENKIPVDFVSSHVYGNDKAEDVFGTNEQIPRNRMVCRAISKVHDQIKSSAMPDLPLIWSEFNASRETALLRRLRSARGRWHCQTIVQCFSTATPVGGRTSCRVRRRRSGDASQGWCLGDCPVEHGGSRDARARKRNTVAVRTCTSFERAGDASRPRPRRCAQSL